MLNNGSQYYYQYAFDKTPLEYAQLNSKVYQLIKDTIELKEVIENKDWEKMMELVKYGACINAIRKPDILENMTYFNRAIQKGVPVKYLPDLIDAGGIMDNESLKIIVYNNLIEHLDFYVGRYPDAKLSVDIKCKYEMLERLVGYGAEKKITIFYRTISI